jgi:hypothetical protein
VVGTAYTDDINDAVGGSHRDLGLVEADEEERGDYDEEEEEEEEEEKEEQSTYGYDDGDIVPPNLARVLNLGTVCGTTPLPHDAGPCYGYTRLAAF